MKNLFPTFILTRNMIPEIPLILFLTLITFFVILSKKKRKEMNTKKLPPGPGKIPIIGNLHQLGKSPHQSLRNLSKTYGDLMFLQLGFIRTLVVSSPDRAREIFKHHDLVLSGRPALYAVKKFTYNFSSMSTAPYGEYWRELRKIVVLELMTAKRVASFGRIRAEEVDYMIKRVVPGRVDLSSLAFSMSNNVVCRIAFGTTNGPEERRRFRGILHEMQCVSSEFNLADYFPGMEWTNRINGVDERINRVFQGLDRFFDEVIEEHRSRSLRRTRPDAENEDIIDVLLRIQKDPNQTICISDEQLKGVLVDVFVAGTDTSAATIEWTMAELIRNPTVMKKAQQEFRKLSKLGKTKIEETDLPNLTYLKLVIKESFRLHPPAPLLVPRETTGSCTIGNEYEIPAKTRIFINAAAIGTDSRYWKDPERFLPERFEDSEVDYKGQHFELLPFGAGRRGCPGIAFSTAVVELALANLLFCFDWKLPEGVSVEDLDMEEGAGITVHKKNPLCLIALPLIK